MPTYVEHDIPDKSRLNVLRVKHAIVGNETKPIADALEEVHAKTAAKAELLDFLPSLNKLDHAIRDFKTKYKTKHPNFIKSLTDDFEKPISSVLASAELVRTAPDAIRKGRTEGYVLLAAARQKLEGPLDENTVKEIRVTITKAGGMLNIMANNAQQIISKVGESPLWREVMNETQPGKAKLNNVDMVLEQVVKAGNYHLPTKPLVTNVQEVVNILINLKAKLK